MLNFFDRNPATPAPKWIRRFDVTGIHITAGGDGEALTHPLLEGFLTQLSDEGHLVGTAGGQVLPWNSAYEVLEQQEFFELAQVLALPDITGLRPSLRSARSLTDNDFSIAVDGWASLDGRKQDVCVQGGLLVEGGSFSRMTLAQWRLFSEVVAFSRRPSADRTDLSHRQAWGRIRGLALAASARVDDFLTRSVVLVPERLHIGLRRSAAVGVDTLVEVIPTFDGAPPNWLDRFDFIGQVEDRYDLVTEQGIVQVIISPKVKTVLREIKRLAGRRIAGARAQAFLLNPYATLGEDARDVIIEQQFEDARSEAGLCYERFTPLIERDGGGSPPRIGLLIEVAGAESLTASENHWFSDDTEAADFLSVAQSALARNFLLIAWKGYEFEVQGDTCRHIDELWGAHEERTQSAIVISYESVHDLSKYSQRIESIGVEKPYYSPYIAKKKEGDGWFPENVVPLVAFRLPGESSPVAVPMSKEALEQLNAAIDAADKSGQGSVEVPWLDRPMSVSEARRIVETFQDVFDDLKGKRFPPPGGHVPKAPIRMAERKSLVMYGNISTVEYEELRRDALKALPLAPEVPRAKSPSFELLEHQLAGLAWLQHLYRRQSEFRVRGAVLADDMGLGKTFQLLSLMAWLVQEQPDIDPMLIVAPVSLLENWKEEADKFYPGALKLLTAYGEDLAPLRVPRDAVDYRLQTEDGLVKFLKPRWLGDAKVVLTTYETLRDLEFSFAAQRWSLMVCDEAQRIKNPAAMVTRAAKKQNVGFKIACTGTPVENTLADLWCLFDFVQPGLLGALDEFGHRYRKPIEAKTDEEKARVAELRERISAQILRRTKQEVAKDLPAKIVVDDCRKLPMSAVQRALYIKAIDSFKRRSDPNSPTPFKNHLGLLHYLRLVCTDPRPYGLTVFKPEPIAAYRAAAPKLDWLLQLLGGVRTKGEKVIVFCEFRNIQRLLQHYIEETFNYRADIINGDTAASATHSASRQKRIKAFQASPGFGVIILSPVAVGFGVNIQAANHVVHFTRTWNPAKEDQATDRAYRIGQKRDVFVYYPVVNADDFATFDVRLDELLASKRALAGDMLNGNPDLAPRDFPIADVVPPETVDGLDERVTLDLALRMDWRYFEGLAGALLHKQGYDLVYCTPGSNDQGVDVVAVRGAEGVLVQTKTSGTDGQRLGWDVVKEVLAGEAFYRRRHPGVAFRKVGLTNQYFNTQATEQAALNGVELLDQRALASMLECDAVGLIDVERMLFSSWESDALNCVEHSS